MRSAANGHGCSESGAHSYANGNSPGGPYMLTICGIPLNQIPPRWQDLLLDFGP